MAMQSSAAFEYSALPYLRLQKLIGQYGALFDPYSDIHQEMSSAIDFVYVAGRLESIHARDLVKRLTDTLLESGNPASLLLEARILQMQGQGLQADQLLLAALESNPGNSIAAYMLLKSRGAALAGGTLPEQLQPYVTGLTDVASAVIESVEASHQRDLSQARDQDDLLARAEPYDQWYLNAAKLRADWRIMAASRGESSGFSTEALDIIDEVIALNQDINFYGMRMAAAFLVNDYDAVVETARRMVWLVRQDFDVKAGTSGGEISANELSRTLVRLESMQKGLSEVRESGLVADYKFDTLDENISELRQNIESLATQ
jgi:hypothetical protein